MKKSMLRISLVFILSISFAILFSQDKQYNWDDPIPFDPNVRIGTLDNGLTFYIRHNELPKDRAEFYLVVNAGAILEDDDQNGLAHFCEHMAFNGTENFEKHDIINYLQSIGMKFGPEINAFTNADATNYMLQKVPTDDQTNLDTALMILVDWASNVSYEDEEIDSERGVIHEEWRTRRGAMFRMMTKTNKTLYKGSKYADRDVIGDIDIIDNFEYDVIKRFYNDWYRPDLQALVAVGDFDVDAMEKQIREMFGEIPKRENPRIRELYEVPDHKETYVAIETDPEASYNIVQIYYKQDPIEEINLGDYRQSVVRQLYNMMVNERLNERLQDENPPFIMAYSAYTGLTPTKDAYVAFALAKNDGIKRSIQTLLEENEKVKRYGFIDSELERAKKEMLSDQEAQFNEKDKMASGQYMFNYYGHFLENEPSPGIEFDYEFIKNVLPGISLEELNVLAPKWIKDHSRVVVITAPEREDVIIPMAPEIIEMVENSSAMEIEAYVDKMADIPLMAELPTPGTIEKIRKNKKLGTEEWLLSNGVKVILKPTDFKDDEIMMRSFSFGGTSLYDVEDLPSAELSSAIANESGLAQFDKIQLQKYLAGMQLQLYPYVGGVDEGLNGSSSVKDFETLLKMVYLYFDQAREDEKAFNAFMNRIKGFMENRKNDPGAAFQDTILVTLADYNPRVSPMSVEKLEEVDFSMANYIFKERFGDPSGFIFYFVGNLDLEKVKPLIETYIGGLPKIKRNESWKDNNVRPPKGVIEKEVVRDLEVPKGTVNITFTGEFDYDNYFDRVNLTALCDILDVRYTESIREEQGGTYGVSVRPGMYKYPYENYSVRIQFDCDPQNVDKLKAIVYEEIEKIKKEGPIAKDLNGVKENKLKTRKENLEKNNYWINKLKSFDYDQADIKDFLKYENYVEKLSQEQLKEAANMYFGDNTVEVILLPANVEDNTVNPMLDK